MGCTCTAIVESVGIIALATTVVQESFWDGLLLISQAKCHRRLSSTPFLGLEGEELQTIFILYQPEKKAFVALV
jgi:hypothetical protein